MATPFYIPTSNVWETAGSTSSSAFVVASIFYFSRSNSALYYLNGALTYVSLLATDVEHLLSCATDQSHMSLGK